MINLLCSSAKDSDIAIISEELSLTYGQLNYEVEKLLPANNPI